jgi:hypothetical protein
MQISNAQYIADMDGNNTTIVATIDGVEVFVPLSQGNRHYAEILRQLEAGTLTIEDAD